MLNYFLFVFNSFFSNLWLGINQESDIIINKTNATIGKPTNAINAADELRAMVIYVFE